jgi:hypothetical protein
MKPWLDDFKLEDSIVKKTTFMNVHNDFAGICTNNESAVLLPFDDYRFSMMCILPNENISMLMKTEQPQVLRQL